MKSEASRRRVGPSLDRDLFNPRDGILFATHRRISPALSIVLLFRFNFLYIAEVDYDRFSSVAA